MGFWCWRRTQRVTDFVVTLNFITGMRNSSKGGSYKDNKGMGIGFWLTGLLKSNMVGKKSGTSPNTNRQLDRRKCKFEDEIISNYTK